MKWSEEVVRVRAMRGETQQAFAHTLGIGIATVQRWEHGRARPTGYRHISALLDAGASLDALLEDGETVAA
jgi:DNA-binding transcriptional regulator YiaG